MKTFVMVLGLASQAVFFIIAIGWGEAVAYRWVEKRAKLKKAINIAFVAAALLNIVFVIYLLVTT